MKKIYSLVCLLLALTAQAQTSKSTGSLTDVAFMEGRWLGTFNGGPIEAAWIAPVGDNLSGFMRMMKDNKVTMYEMLIFEQTSEGPIVLVKHFKPGLIGQEEKDKSDRYRFIEASPNRALFEKEDGSIRIIYEKRGANQLVIQRGQPKDGSWSFSDLFVFKRVN
ncbi:MULTISPECIES: DUF6265 family protein [unclassified Spirosoma]|uniref:DUF6265 family protein n=1 Tax=unclassified Spirosoma TaxID=2621999 RepID=UPI0009667F50|nr:MULTISPECIES: DUF6265 family protein [unclassified Spirosoma]MBN8822810.1 hypothetical protein [Spirosoma sp.]OJW80011.1 MAG: hypothetical protein BGO59_02025 [Spirosoma sp. 48-14]